MRKVFLIGLVGLLMAGTAQADARLDIPVKLFDFGYVPQQSTISVDYWLKSTGTEDLRILKVIPGCGCTKTPLEKDVLSPGDSTRLEVIFDSKRFTNRVTKKPRIQTNVGDQRLEFMAMVVRRPDSTRPLVLKPYRLELEPAGESAAAEARFTIRNVSDEALSLDMVASRDRLFSVELPETIAPGQEAEAVVRLTAEGASADFEKSFTFEVSDATTTRYTVPVVRETNSGPGAVSGPLGKSGK